MTKLNALCLLFFVTTWLGCSSNTQTRDGKDPESGYGLVVAVRKRPDPLGGFFSAKLQHVYFSGQSNPGIFCAGGPDIPIGEKVTIFFEVMPETIDRSRCYRVIAVVQGPAFWKDGRPVTREEYEKAKAKAKANEPFFSDADKLVTVGLPVKGRPCVYVAQGHLQMIDGELALEMSFGHTNRRHLLLNAQDLKRPGVWMLTSEVPVGYRMEASTARKAHALVEYAQKQGIQIYWTPAAASYDMSTLYAIEGHSPSECHTPYVEGSLPLEGQMEDQIDRRR